MSVTFSPSTGFLMGERRAILVGRAADMRELDDALDAVRAKKQCRAVTVIGAAGVGKTRLVREFLMRVHTGDRPPRIFRGSAREGGPSYGVFARVLKARFGIVEGMDSERAKLAVREQLSKVLEDRKVGDVAYFLGQLMDLEFPDSPLIKAVEDDREQLRQLRRAVIRRFFEADAVGGGGPLILVFDDLQFAHDDSLDLLEHLVSTLAGPILVVCLARPELIVRRDGWRRGEGHRMVDLGPLSETDAAAMMQDLLAPGGEDEAVDDLIDAACTLAGGNPALLEQMVRIYHDMGVLEVVDPLAEEEKWKVHPEKLASVRLPITVDDAIAARIAALAPSERELLERAAAIGGVFWLGALVVMHRTAAGAPQVDPETWAGEEGADVARVRELLKELIDRDYILRLPDSTFPGDEELVFKHNKERETLQKMTPPGAARAYNGAIAEWLSSKDTALVHEEYVAMLARHREKAGRFTLAAQSYLRAADIARSRYANALAAEHYAHALRMAEKGAELTADEHIHALHQHGDVLQLLARGEEALASFRAMLREAFRLDRHANAGAAHSRIGRFFRDTGRLAHAERHLGAALALFKRAGDERGIASTTDDVGKLYWLRGDYPKALETTQQALAMRRRIGDRRSIALSLNNLGLVYQDSGQARHALDAFEQALVIRREIGDLVGVAITLNNLGTVAQDQRDDKRAHALFTEAYEVAKETGDRNRIALVLTNLGETLTRLGDSARAIEYLKQAEELADEMGDELGLAEAVRGLGKAYLARREYTRARECIGRAVKIFERVQSRVQLGIALRSLGEVTAAGSAGGEDTQRARAYFRESISIFEEAGNEVELGRTLRAYGEAMKDSFEDQPEIKKEVDAARKRSDDLFAKLRLDVIGL